MLKQVLKRYLFGLLATTYFQPIFERLHVLALSGMNIGLGSDVDDSGEKYALGKFAETMPFNSILVVFDVGANQGDFARAVVKILNTRVKIHCFEPSPTTFRILEKTLHANPNIQLHNLGLSERQEEATLYLDKEGSGCASLYRRNLGQGLVMALTEQVRLRGLDEFCAESGIDHIHYLKLDVEGHELGVLRGASRMISAGAIDWIQFEFGGCNLDSRTYFRDFFDLLNSRYALYRLLRNGFAPIRYYNEKQEVFSTTNFVALRRPSDCP